jgi:hypothetical protein
MTLIAREPAEYVECDGSADCEAHEHIEGCYATMRPDAGEVERLSRELAGAVDLLRGVLSGRVVRDETENGDPILLDLATDPATLVRFDRFEGQ